MRYLARAWPHRADLADLRQEVYVRLYESAARARPGAPRAFLFATARNLMADRVRRNRVISIDTTQDFESLNVLVDEISPEQRVNARQELRCLALAFDQLSDKCREVIWLRRVEGLSQREAAQRLGLNEGAVESQLSRGVRSLARAVFGRGNEADLSADGASTGVRGHGNDSGHG